MSMLACLNRSSLAFGHRQRNSQLDTTGKPLVTANRLKVVLGVFFDALLMLPKT